MDNNKKLEFLITDGFSKVSGRIRSLEKVVEDGFTKVNNRLDKIEKPVKKIEDVLKEKGEKIDAFEK